MAKGNRRWHVRLEDVEHQVIEALPNGFPFVPGTNLRYRDTLIVARKHEFDRHRPTSPCCFGPVSYSQISTQLGRGVLLQGTSSIFSRHGLTEPDGSPIRLRTHQLRHYLNTIAQQGGLSQLDIAKWSGRKTIQQNEAYDHVSAYERANQIQDAIGDGTRMMGPLATLPEPLPMTREEYARLRAPTAHLTEIGVCTHDWAAMPCLWFLRCHDCEKHVLQKTPEARARVQMLCEETRLLLESAQDATGNGYAGANRWRDKHTSTYERLCQIRAIMDDPSVAEETFFQIPPVEAPGA